MIGRITGKLLEKLPPLVLIDVQGMGYEVDVPMSTFYNLPAVGAQVVLHTHLVVREDVHLLFGFATEAERQATREHPPPQGLPSSISVDAPPAAESLRDARVIRGQNADYPSLCKPYDFLWGLEAPPVRSSSPLAQP